MKYSGITYQPRLKKSRQRHIKTKVAFQFIKGQGLYVPQFEITTGKRQETRQIPDPLSPNLAPILSRRSE